MSEFIWRFFERKNIKKREALKARLDFAMTQNVKRH